MAAPLIKFEIDTGVAQIALNRPDKLNSFNREMAGELQARLQECAEDSKVRSVLLSGEGRGFCAGQDLAEVAPQFSPPGPLREQSPPGPLREQSPPGPLRGLKELSPNLGAIVRESYNPIILAIRQLEKPVICVVRGVAAGAGANLAFACDIVFAAREASFIQSFSKVGLIPDSGGTFILPRLIGLARATALAFLAEKLSAEEARNMGLIWKVCDSESVYEEALRCARYLATQPTLGLGLTKRAFNNGLCATLEQQLGLEEKLQHQAGLSADFREGVTAFLEKRAPSFRGE